MTAALSLFAGGGGLDLGARMAGLDVVASIEREAVACSTLRINGFHSVEADVTTVDFRQWRGVELIFGGPPCQGHSRANSLKRGIERNGLAWEMIRAARETGARCVLVENVDTFNQELLQQMCSAFVGLGYWVASTVLNAADYGVPQSRRRRFIWACRDLLTQWPEATHIGRRVSIDAALTGLQFRNAPLPTWLSEMEVDPSWRLLDAQNQTKYGGQGRSGDLPAPTMVTSSYYNRVRTADGWGMLDPQGMARFQSFPDEHIFSGNRGQQSTQIGNAVPPLLAYHLLRGVA